VPVMADWDATIGPPPAAVRAEDVAAAFAGRGLVAPPSYAAFAAAFGGRAFKTGHNYVRPAPGGEPVHLGPIFHYAPAPSEELGPDLVPIGAPLFNAVICLDYRDGRQPPSVVIYDFDAIPGREVQPLAPSFEALLDAVGPR
jgi:hypothetical protein